MCFQKSHMKIWGICNEKRKVQIMKNTQHLNNLQDYGQLHYFVHMQLHTPQQIQSKNQNKPN